jgi:hypothetical protein
MVAAFKLESLAGIVGIRSPFKRLGNFCYWRFLTGEGLEFAHIIFGPRA